MFYLTKSQKCKANFGRHGIFNKIEFKRFRSKKRRKKSERHTLVHLPVANIQMATLLFRCCALSKERWNYLVHYSLLSTFKSQDLDISPCPPDELKTKPEFNNDLKDIAVSYKEKEFKRVILTDLHQNFIFF